MLKNIKLLLFVTMLLIIGSAAFAQNNGKGKKEDRKESYNSNAKKKVRDSLEVRQESGEVRKNKSEGNRERAEGNKANGQKNRDKVKNKKEDDDDDHDDDDDDDDDEKKGSKDSLRNGARKQYKEGNRGSQRDSLGIRNGEKRSSERDSLGSKQHSEKKKYESKGKNGSKKKND
jgi:hypothetical protein